MKVFLVVIFSFLIFYESFSQERKSSYGGVFTPKGDLKVLIVPVIFKDHPVSNPQFVNSAQWIEGWSLTNTLKLPDCVNPLTGEFPNWLYNKAEDFEMYGDSVFNNVSKVFYNFSKGNFRFMADIFRDSANKPSVVEIDPEGGRDWSHMNKKAMDEMRFLAPDFDFSPFDKRKNNPQYQFDNSLNPKPDKIVDYIIFIYRFSPNWSVYPAPGMNKWTGSGGGFASPSGVMLENFNGYKFSEGFTMMWNSGVFVHELAHTLFNAPHLWGANGTVGNYFYRPSVGWGTTSTVPLFQGFNAWECWYAGFSEISYDVNDSTAKIQNEFILNDFLTSGEFMRIEIPFSGGQFLWLENHAKLHPLDHHIWRNSVIDKDTLSDTPAGIYAYIESIAPTRTKIIGALSDACNGLKILNAAGNYDYDYNPDNMQKNAWGNNLYTFTKGKENPISGTNPYYIFRADFNKNGTIEIDNNFNSAKNEGEAISRMRVNEEAERNFYHNLGGYNFEKDGDFSRSPAFGDGDILNMGSNPLLTNYPKYDPKKQSMEPVYLNGLKISFTKLKNEKFKVKVEYKKTTLDRNARWTGNIVLPDITGDSLADLQISEGKTLKLDKSGIANRHTKTTKGDFINATQLTVKSGARIVLKKNSRIIVENDSIFEFETNSTLVLERNAKIVVESGSQMILNGVKPKLSKKAKIIIK